LEQGTLTNAYNFSLPSCPAGNQAPNMTPVGGLTSYLANTTVTSSVISSYVCPSDVGLQPLNPTTPVSTATSYAGFKNQRTNYLLPCGAYYDGYNGPKINGRPSNGGVFAGNDFATKISNITDGTSNTTLVLESRTEKTSASYGGYWGQGTWTSTHAIVYDPNPLTPTPIYSPNYASTLPNGAATIAQAASNPRRLGYAWSISSLHPGGINAAFADGSVKFIKNTVSPITYMALSSAKGNEVISSDAY
jgi:prepilin-type processing-associated H-X9-DG protein